jgi:hypothetical protein
MTTNNAGFVHNGANGNAFLRWWPVIAFILAQFAGAAVIAWQVAETRIEVKEIKVSMVTRTEWKNIQDFRADQIQGLRDGQRDLANRFERHTSGR